MVTYPKLNVPAYQAVVTYRGQDPVPRTLFIALSDVAKGREEDLKKQIDSKTGDLYKQYLAYRSKKIREDIDAAATRKAETLRV